jgi:hemerythrin-like domain-containing protein
LAIRQIGQSRSLATGTHVAQPCHGEPEVDAYAQGSFFMTHFKQRLLDDHAELEGRLQRLADSVDANDPCSELRTVWAEFESNLLDHLDTEERCLFPVVAREHRAEIEALRAEHQHIRRTVAELGVCVELHTLRKQSVTDLIELLQRHAERENNSLYEWSERQSEGRALQGLFAMFERRAHREGSEPTAPMP